MNSLIPKPIFHQNAKSFASGTFASPNAKDSSFALPNARNTNMLVSFALGDANFFRVLPDASQWNIGGVGPSGIEHVHFIFFV